MGDVISGVTVAATSLPQYIAYAELAGLAAHRGLRTSGPPQIAFALLTGSPSLCVSVTSITALMVFADLRGSEYKEAFGEEAWADLVGAYALMVGLASLLLAFSGAAALAEHIPGPVKAGWKLGFALTVVGAQVAGAVFAAGAATARARCVLPSWPWSDTGAPLSGGAAAMYRLGWSLAHPHLWDPAAAGLAALALAVVLRGKDPFQRTLRLPGAEVLAATVLGTVVALNLGYTGDVVGTAPAPAPPAGASSAAAILTGWVQRWPWEMPLADVAERLGGWHWAIFSAVTFAGVDFLAVISVEAERPPPGGWSPPRELAGQGVACIVSGMSGSAPIGGSLSRSMVAGMTGAGTPLAGFICGLATLALGLPAVSSLLAPMPKSVLAAVVLAAVLPSAIYPKDVLRLKGADAVVGWATALASCFVDPTRGFGIGLVLAAALWAARRAVSHGDEKRRKG